MKAIGRSDPARIYAEAAVRMSITDGTVPAIASVAACEPPPQELQAKGGEQIYAKLCSSCHAPLEPLWQICPYCETEVPGAVQLAQHDLALAAAQGVGGQGVDAHGGDGPDD